MAGYTRQSAGSIYNGAEITAPPLNAEFNRLDTAFNGTVGHIHDGSVGNAPKIDLTTSISGYLPVVHGGIGGKSKYDGLVNPTITDDATSGYAVGSLWANNNTGRTFICIGNTANAAVWRELTVTNLTTNDITPETTDTIDLGSPTNRFQDLYLSGGMAASGNSSIGGTFTVTGAAALNGTVSTNAITATTATISGGTLDNSVIGNSTPQAVTGTVITANTGFTGDLTGNVTGNITGNVSGNITGNVTGDISGNVTSTTGSSTFNDVVINGTLNMDASSAATITNLSTPVNNGDAAPKIYVDTAIANLVGGAPTTLDTLNELAAALNDDANAFNSLTTQINTKLTKAGDTMTGDLNMGSNTVISSATPTSNNDLTNKGYVDTQRDTRLAKAGDTMSGNLNMGSNQITNLPSPSTTDMAANKGYVDSILGSATASATSAAAAAVSETNAATSAQQALSHAQSAANTLDTFDDRFLGAKASAPVVDNDGNALVTGALYFNTTNDTMYVFNGAVWLNFSPVEYGVTYTSYTATEGQTSFTVNYDIGFVSVWMNGVKLLVGTDFTATSGTDIVLSNAASVGDVIDITAHGVFTVADALDQGQADGRYLQISNDLSDLNDAPTARTNLGLAIGTDVQAYSANLASINQNLSTTSDVTFNTIMGNYTAPTTNHGLSTNTSFVVDISDGQIQTLTLGASTTITSTLDNGQQLMLMIDDGSGYTITWSGFTWANNDGVAPSLVTTGYNTFAIWKVNNTNYISYAGDQ